jgi:DNA-cytosine methyltransferase
VSPIALSRWREIVLMEDDSARAVRRAEAGVADGAASVLIRAHRIGSKGITVAAERSYVPGFRGPDTKQRSDLALDLVDRVSCAGSVVVCGPAYGCSPSFLQGLAARGLDAVVEIRPSSRVAVEQGERPGGVVAASALLDSARWRNVIVPVPGVPGRSVTFAVAALGAGRLGSGPKGSLFAALTGGISGVHPGTVIGICLADSPQLEELLEAVGWARWIRPLVRRAERPAPTGEAAHSNGGPGAASGAGPRLRANIKLSSSQDQADAAARLIAPRQIPFRRTLATVSKPINVVELFAGAGGMGLGFLLAGRGRPRYRLVYSGEVDPVYVATLRGNHAALDDGILPTSARLTPAAVDPVDLRSNEALKEVARRADEWGGTDVLIGGPPCQGFSNANRNSWHSANPHNELIDVFLNHAVRLAPRAFLLENVQGIHWTRKGGAPQARSSVLDHIRERMAAAGYEVFVQLLDAVWYGVPQYRSRVFVLGLHRDLGYHADDFGHWGPFPQPSHGPGTSQEYVTVRAAIHDLPRVSNGHSLDRTTYPEPTGLSETSFLAFLRQGAEHGAITDHVTSKHAEYVIQRYRMIPPGGNWESIADILTNYADVNRTHSNIYRRLVWNEPSITIGHYRKSMLVHPSQDRGLSLREAARLQSFPDWFRFAGNANGGSGGLVHKQQQLANAVCPLVTKAIADFILEL